MKELQEITVYIEDTWFIFCVVFEFSILWIHDESDFFLICLEICNYVTHSLENSMTHSEIFFAYSMKEMDVIERNI